MFITKRLAGFMALGMVFIAPLQARADIGLIQYDAMMLDPWLTNAGHAGVYLSNICMGEVVNTVRICNDADKATGYTGTLVQRYSNLAGRSTKQAKVHPNQDWILMPINMNLYGTLNHDSAPILAAPKVQDKLRAEAYQNPSLHIQSFTDPDTAKDIPARVQEAKDESDVALAKGDWQYSIGASALRGAHLLTLPTTVEEDQRVVDYLNNPKNNENHFQGQLNNCANFANNVFKVAKGANNFQGRGWIEDAFLVSPSSDAKGVRDAAKKENVPYTVMVLNQTPGTYAKSSAPTEMVTDSNTNIGVGQLVSHLLPAPAGTIFTIVKIARRFGLPVPGFRNYMDVSGKETKQHGTDALAKLTFDLQAAQKAKDKAKANELKVKRQELQNETFGTGACWKTKRSEFQNIMAAAFNSSVVDRMYQKSFQMHNTVNSLLRRIPIAHINPTHAKLIKYVMNGADSSVEQKSDGLVLTKAGVSAGLTRENVEHYDPKLGFLVMASSLVYQMDSDETLMIESFDDDWNTLVKLARTVGLTAEGLNGDSMKGCSTKADPTIETPLVAPTTAKVDVLVNDETTLTPDQQEAINQNTPPVDPGSSPNLN